MNKYTVVLMRPDYATEEYGEDCYVALVEAPDPYKAVGVAQAEVVAADLQEYLEEIPHYLPELDPGDYALLVLFEGHHDVKLFGFQL